MTNAPRTWPRWVAPLLVGVVGFAAVHPFDAEVAADRLDQEYETAMNIAFAEVPFGFERVDEFPWTEIDFKEDVEKASALAKKL